MILSMGTEMINETVGQRIKRIRLAMGLTQKELSGKLGVSSEHLNRWENDHHKPHRVFIKALDKIYAEWEKKGK